MARGYLKEKEYRLTDIKKYFRSLMYQESITQKDIARAIGSDPSTVCRKFKSMDFNLGELLIILRLLKADQDKVAKLLTL